MYPIGFIGNCIFLHFFLPQFTHRLLEKGQFFRSVHSRHFTLMPYIKYNTNYYNQQYNLKKKKLKYNVNYIIRSNVHFLNTYTNENSILFIK
jgi:hypothetical protein